MSKSKIYLPLLLIIPFIFISFNKNYDNNTFSPSTHNLPEKLADYNVLAVLTSDNVICFQPGQKRLILQTTQNFEEFLKNDNQAFLNNELSKLQEKWSISIVGPGVSQEQVWSQNEKWNDQARSENCPKLLPAETNPNGFETVYTQEAFGRAKFENIDAGNFSDDNAQSVNLIAPATVGNNQDLYMAFLNNVRVDNATFFILQNGFLFEDGVGKVVWTTTALGYSAQDYSLLYFLNHSYFFSLTYTNSHWWACVNDNYFSGGITYECGREDVIVGTSIALDPNTAVWVENGNTNSNWYQGFSAQLEARGARIYRNGVGQYWSNQHIHTSHSCSSSWPAANVMGTSTLVGGASGYFTLSAAPLRCP
jgi:hypothetical protein